MQRNVKRRHDGDMPTCWKAVGMLIVERSRRNFRYRRLTELVIAIERSAGRIAHRPDTAITQTQVSRAVTV